MVIEHSILMVCEWSRECAAYLDKIAQSLRLFAAALFKAKCLLPAGAVVLAGIRVGFAIRAALQDQQSRIRPSRESCFASKRVLERVRNRL
jgi:hypothetical protein